MNNIFGKNLLAHLKKRGMSPADLARKCKIARSTVHYWIAGKTEITASQLKKVATVLEVGIHELGFGESDPYGLEPNVSLVDLFRGDVRLTVQKINRKKEPP
ncbi:helix-turn-helix transcriptional regulator [Bdellovibrionota bacterium FG-2]